MADTIDENRNQYIPIAKDDEDLFKGELETFVENSFYGNPMYTGTKILPEENFSSVIKPKRPQFYKIIITRPKREFESSVQFLLEKIAGDDTTPGNNEIKGVKSTNDFPLQERAYLDLGLQTANEATEKGFQVPKVRAKNSYTQVEKGMTDIIMKFESKGNSYLTDPNKLRLIETFLNRVRPRMEAALQSNETINVFKNDFDLDRFSHIQAEEKKTKQAEMRTFRHNTAGNKNKKEKCVNHIRFLKDSEPFAVHSLLRNFTFEERIKNVGIPHQTKILFWNFKDIEQNSPIFFLEVPCEVTCFEFNPVNIDKVVCAMISGQLIMYEFKDLIRILQRNSDSESNITQKKVTQKELCTYYMTSLTDSHKSRISSLKWFPRGYYLHKGQLHYNESYKDVNVIASLGEDGQILIWDMSSVDKSAENDVNPYFRYIRVEVNKFDAVGKICGTGLEIKKVGNSVMIYVSTDEGQVYGVDVAIKNTMDNAAANVRKLYYTRYFRPIIYFQTSPFFDYIFMTVHDFHFCLWAESRFKPIFISPNLKKSSYTCARFSPSRPGVIYLTRNNGKIDIWDFLDESHKPSVKDSFIKELITSIELFRYFPPSDDDDDSQQNVRKNYIEYMAIGDASGQMTIMEVPRLFAELANDEMKLMTAFFENEIKRQDDMEMRYKSLDEEMLKCDPSTADKDKDIDNEAEHEIELRYAEEAFKQEKEKIEEELGIFREKKIIEKPEQKK